MSTIYKIVGSICITTYILGLVTNLVDLNYTQKAIKLVFALYFLTVVLVPLKDMDFDFSEIKYETQNVQSDAEDYIVSSAAKRIEDEVKKVLNKENIAYSDVYVHIDEQSAGICLEYIKICGVSGNNHIKVKDMLDYKGKIIFGE